MKKGLVLLFFLFFQSLPGQEVVEKPIDERYREDQFYLGISFNLLLNFPTDVSQNGLSYGLQGGFIRDIPLNRACTFALGIGLGYGFNSYYSNLRALQTEGGIDYVILDDPSEYKRNKLETHRLEVPLEFRWRNSTRESYKFWRIYTGLRFGYRVGSRSKFVGNDFVDSFSNPDIRDFTYGLSLNMGYNTFNLHLYYGLNRLFEDGIVGPDNQQLDMVPLRIGLIFFIL